MNQPTLSVIVPAHNPHPGRLQRTLAGLRAQTLPAREWETILVDNASSPALVAVNWSTQAPANFRLVREPEPGLSHARRRGFTEARGDIAVLVDDDNVLAPDYLATVLSLFAQHPQVGALGGRSLPEFETAPPAWTREFFSLLALRDPGEAPLLSHGLRPAGSAGNEYPVFAPIGAGMALRRPAWTAWLEARREQPGLISDRRGEELTSGGDNDIVLHLMRAGWEVGYFPALALTHLIPPARLEKDYLARLNRGISRSWVRVLAVHGIRPWPPVAPATVWLRQWRAWWRTRAWQSDAAWVKWRGLCGTFEGQADLTRLGEDTLRFKPDSNP
jgi:glycosyltransferase involved in cell wall biosynthesis